ncbi:MAG: phenylacetate-CoA oxygenase subunit PaaI [Chloroflexi bacterium]|nr:phenylacetate-CoA oxygenase subunit PaaI [Chloroflexota bacterium]
MPHISEEQLKARLENKQLVETEDQMTDQYKEDLIRILTVSADTELISAPAYYHAARHAPSINALISALAIIQDEMGHAHIAYRLLEDLGVKKEEYVYKRAPAKFKHPYAFDMPLESWEELVVANAFYDRAGITLLGDIYRNTTYGPWKRALVKVDREETFHLRHGEIWMRRIAQEEGGRARLQKCVDWMFLLTVEWFGLPDDLKKHAGQLSYGIKGSSNDTLRQQWLKTAVPLCEELKLDIPARWDDAQQKFIITCPFPAHFDAENKRWKLEDGAITWDEVMKRWRARGPANQYLIGRAQRGHHEMARAA